MTSYLSRDKIRFEVNDSSIPKRDTNYGWKMTTELRVVFSKVNVSVHFLKVLLN